MIVVQVNQNQQIQPNQPIEQNNVINNQQKPKPKTKFKKEKKIVHFGKKYLSLLQKKNRN